MNSIVKLERLELPHNDGMELQYGGLYAKITLK